MAKVIIWGVSLFFLVSLNGELLEQKEVVQKTNEAEGPKGLQWVTIQEWNNMPGGTENNPLIYHWCPHLNVHKDDFCITVRSFLGAKDDKWLRKKCEFKCKHFIQVKHNGCWQTGQDREEYEGEPHIFKPLIGNNGWSCCPYDSTWGGYFNTQLKRLMKNSKYRVLVNPGNSVDFTWLDWDYSKPFPKNVVYGDKRCELKVATYTDSIIHNIFGGYQAGQVDKDGYIYYGSGYHYDYDYNEYKILVEHDVKEYELLSIEYHISEATKVINQAIKEFTFINNDTEPATRRTTLSLSEISSSTWSHAITWGVGQFGSFKISVGPEALAGSVESTLGYSIKVGGSHGWGGSEEVSVVGSETVIKKVPPKSEAKVTMSAEVSHENVPSSSENYL